jgi:hypothetical protein
MPWRFFCRERLAGGHYQFIGPMDQNLFEQVTVELGATFVR